MTAGDLLLTFGDATVGRGRTAAPWRTAFAERAASLQVQEVTAEWRGFPLLGASDANWELWLVGELYDAPDVPARLRDVAAGRRPASALNGHFLVIGYHRDDRRWHVWTDRFGTVHAFIGRAGGRVAIGTSFGSVSAAASARQLDWPGLASYFACGFFLADRTFYRDVAIIEPATHVVLDDRGATVTSERYWSWRYTPDHALSATDAADEIASALRRVLAEQAGAGRIALPISGGLDSRTTVACLPRGGAATLWPYSYGYTRDSQELRIARQIAAARALPLCERVVGPYLFGQIGQIGAALEGFADATQPRQAAIGGELGDHADRVIAAHWGDVWFDDMGLVDHPALGEAALVDHALAKLRKTGSDWLLDHVCAPRLGRDAPALVRDQVSAALAGTAPLGEPDFRVKAFKTDQWSFRWTLTSLRMFQVGAYPRLPFYDTRLTDLFARIPSALLRGRGVQVVLLKRHAADLAAITWQAHDANLYLYRYRSLQLVKRAWRRIARAASRRPLIRRNWEIQFARGDALDRALLRAGHPLHDVVAPPQIRQLLARPRDGRSAAGWGYAVSMLLTFGAWLETSA